MTTIFDFLKVAEGWEKKEICTKGVSDSKKIKKKKKKRGVRWGGGGE